jgi:hypothetical protein
MEIGRDRRKLPSKYDFDGDPRGRGDFYDPSGGG